MPRAHVAIAMLVIAWLIEEGQTARPEGHELIENAKVTYTWLNAALV